MDFGKWIIVSFILFAIFIGTLVTVCFRQDVNLVSRNYYQEELKHQEKMDQLKNTDNLKIKPAITLEGNIVKVYFPEFKRMDKGELKLLRPSDERLDQKFQLKTTNDTIQQFALKIWDRGLYRASMHWTSGGRDYFFENLLVK